MDQYFEYFGAGIDLDTDSLKRKLDDVEKDMESLSKSANKTAIKIGNDFNDAVKGIGTKPLQETVGEMESVLKELDSQTDASLQLMNGQLDGFKKSVGEATETLRGMIDTSVEAARVKLNDGDSGVNVEACKNAEETAQRLAYANKAILEQTNTIGQSAAVASEKTEGLTEESKKLIEATEKLSEVHLSIAYPKGEIGDGGIAYFARSYNDLFKSIKDGKVDVEEATKKLEEMQEAVDKQRIAAVSEKDRKSLNRLNREIKNALKNVNGIASADDVGKGIVDKLSKYLGYAKNLISGAVKGISTVLRASGVGTVLSGLSYACGLISWNYDLIGQKIANIGDKIKVLAGLKTAEDALADSVRRRSEAIKEQTDALNKNILAEQNARSVREKGEAFEQSNKSMRDFLNEYSESKEFKFLPEFLRKHKNPTAEEFIGEVNGKENKEAVGRYLSVATSPGLSQKYTAEEVNELKRQSDWALARSEALGKLNEARKKLATAEEEFKQSEERRNKNIGNMAYEASYDAKATEVRRKRAELENVQKEYDELLRQQEKVRKTEEAIGRYDTAERYQRESGDAKAKMERLEKKDLGGGEWAALQSQIDNASEALRKFSDLRAYELSLIRKKEEYAKKATAVSDTEWSQLENLEAEYKAINEQIRYLRGNGVDSGEQRDMVESLGLEAKAKAVQIENAQYEKQVTLLQRVAQFKKECNELDGRNGWEIDNATIDIETTKERIRLLEEERNISDKEANAIKELTALLERQIAAKQRLTDQKFADDIAKETNMEIRRLEVERKLNGLESHRNGRTDAEVAADDKELRIQQANARLDEAEARRARLLERKNEYLRQQKDLMDGITDCAEETAQWTEKDAETLKELNVEVAERAADVEEANDSGNGNPNKDPDKNGNGGADKIEMIRIGAEGLSDAFGKVADSIEKLGGNSTAAGVFKGLSEGLADASALAGSLFSAFDDIDKNGEISPMSKMQLGQSALQATLNIVSTITDQIAENRRQQELWNQAMLDSAHRASMIKIENAEYESPNIWGGDSYENKLKGLMEKKDVAMNELDGALDTLEKEGQVQVGTKTVMGWQNAAKCALEGAVAGAAIGTMIEPGIGTGIAAAAGAIGGFITGLFAGKQKIPIYKKLTEEYGELFNEETMELNEKMLADYDKMDDKTKKLLDNAKEIVEKAKEAKEEYEDTVAEMTDDIYKNMSDALVKAFTSGDVYGAVEDFRKFLSKSIGNIMSNAIFDAYYGKRIKQLSDAITNSETTDSKVISDQIAETLSYVDDPARLNSFRASMQDMQRQFEDFDLWMADEADSQEALKGTIAGMSEETAGKINGNFMGLKLTAMEINTSVASITASIETSRRVMDQSLAVQREIADNTNYCRNLEAIRGDIAAMRRDGVRAL